MTDASTQVPSIEQSRPNLARLIIGGVCVLGMLATFLPWVQAPIVGSLSGARGDGWFNFAGFGLALLVAMMPRPSAALAAGRRVVIGLLACGCVALAVSKIVAISDMRAEHEADGGLAAAFSAGTSVGNGVWLAIFTGIATVVLCLVLRDRNIAGR